MKNNLVSILFCFFTLFSHAKEGKSDWGVLLGTSTSKLKIGGRLQGVVEFSTNNGKQDLFLRRTRVNLQYETNENHVISLDLRNDNSNKDDLGEGKFIIGDAYYEIPLQSFGLIKDITFFRAKVDVSYSQTASSKNLIHPNRESSSEYASNFIIHNRRANNIQFNGENSWMTFQLALSDGVQSESINSTFGSVSVNSISKQALVFGGKIRFFLWNTDEDKAPIQETFYKETNTFSFGLGAFINPKVSYQLSNGSALSESRKLYNIEFSYSFKKLRLLGEYFLFVGDTINLAQSRFGKSHGGYVRGEYLIGKLAPYFGLNVFKRDETNEQSFEKSQLLGVNYYENGALRRYGISFKTYDYANSLNLQDKKEIMTYILIDY